MAEGLWKDRSQELRIIAFLLIGGLALIAGGIDAFDIIEEDGTLERTTSNNILDIMLLLGFVSTTAGSLIITLSSVKIAGNNSDWIWFALILGGIGAPFYYFIIAPTRK
tara:strand:+ start:3080 stop:3406 length:327 start_codon:yes stop_codon:yes gene_type:complete